MQQLSVASTRIFCALMDSLKDGYLKITMNDPGTPPEEETPFMPLTMECIGEAMLPPYGKATLYSLCHYYIQCGDLMQDPEMCFAVVDERNNLTDYKQVMILPYMYQQANLGIYETSMDIVDGRFTAFNFRKQLEHTAFANDWLENIKDQGYLVKLQKDGDRLSGNDNDEEPPFAV